MVGKKTRSLEGYRYLSREGERSGTYYGCELKGFSARIYETFVL